MKKENQKKVSPCQESTKCLCPYCDGELSGTASFCQPCNKKFVACPKCQTLVESDSAQCPRCSTTV
ncbi:MAG: zinc ribbon domain-containing protein [Planctomycetota bacterium]